MISKAFKHARRGTACGCVRLLYQHLHTPPQEPAFDTYAAAIRLLTSSSLRVDDEADDSSMGALCYPRLLCLFLQWLMVLCLLVVQDLLDRQPEARSKHIDSWCYITAAEVVEEWNRG